MSNRPSEKVSIAGLVFRVGWALDPDPALSYPARPVDPGARVSLSPSLDSVPTASRQHGDHLPCRFSKNNKTAPSSGDDALLWAHRAPSQVGDPGVGVGPQAPGGAPLGRGGEAEWGKRASNSRRIRRALQKQDGGAGRKTRGALGAWRLGRGG